MTLFPIEYLPNRCLSITPPGTSYRSYRIPYRVLLSRNFEIDPKCGFIVYLLTGKDESNHDCLYVGTLVNGLKNRPTSHEDKGAIWENCIVFSSFDEKLLNGSIILNVEDRIKDMIDHSGRYVNKTVTTTREHTNNMEVDLCDNNMNYLVEVYDVLGIDLLTHCTESAESNAKLNSLIPQGNPILVAYSQ